MNSSAIHQFEKGKAYLVAHRETSASGEHRMTRKVRRIFKGMEERFGDIPCAVFTTQVSQQTCGSFDEATGTLTIRGNRLPAAEISIPHYDLMLAEPA